MTDKEKEQLELKKKQRYEREKKICTLAHSVAQQAVALEDISYEDSFAVFGDQRLLGRSYWDVWGGHPRHKTVDHGNSSSKP